MQRTATYLALRASAVTRALVATMIMLVLLSLAGQLIRHQWGYDGVFVRLFDVDAEQSVPTFFAVLLLLWSALLLGVIAAVRREQGDPDWTKWMVLFLGFLLMAIDEAASVHERTIRPVRALLGDGPLGFFYYAWVLPAIVMVVALGFYFARFLIRLPSDVRATFLIAAVLFLGGAIGIELAGGGYAEAYGNDDLGYSLIVTVEESLEMAGVIVFIHALMKYTALRIGPVAIGFSFSGSSARMPGTALAVPEWGYRAGRRPYHATGRDPVFRPGVGRQGS